MYNIFLLISMLLALFLPQFGNFLAQFPVINTILVMIIFFNMGVKFEFNQLLNGLKDFKIILAILISSFIIGPLVAFGFSYIFNIAVVLVYVSSLPTTTTSCVVLTKAYDGDEIASLYGATFGNVVGVLVTPLIIQLLIPELREYTDVDLSHIIISLSYMIILPIIIGQLSRNINIQNVKPIIIPLSFIGKYSMFLFLYINLSQCVSERDFYNIISSLQIEAILIFILVSVMTIINIMIAKLINFSSKQCISLTFCGTQKTLGFGIPLALIYFQSNLELQSKAIILLILYYLIASILPGFAIKIKNRS